LQTGIENPKEIGTRTPIRWINLRINQRGKTDCRQVPRDDHRNPRVEFCASLENGKPGIIRLLSLTSCNNNGA